MLGEGSDYTFVTPNPNLFLVVLPAMGSTFSALSCSLDETCLKVVPDMGSTFALVVALMTSRTNLYIIKSDVTAIFRVYSTSYGDSRDLPLVKAGIFTPPLEPAVPSIQNPLSAEITSPCSNYSPPVLRR